MQFNVKELENSLELEIIENLLNSIKMKMNK